MTVVVDIKQLLGRVEIRELPRRVDPDGATWAPMQHVMYDGDGRVVRDEVFDSGIRLRNVHGILRIDKIHDGKVI